MQDKTGQKQAKQHYGCSLLAFITQQKIEAEQQPQGKRQIHKIVEIIVFNHTTIQTSKAGFCYTSTSDIIGYILYHSLADSNIMTFVEDRSD
jgi:hypothetical protein